jgi:predicted alpha/beta superfamily hydrolase
MALLPCPKPAFKREFFAFVPNGVKSFVLNTYSASRYSGMRERATAQLFGWSLGGLFFVMLSLNALFR